MATCVFTGPRAQDCSSVVCLCQALGRTHENLTHAEEMALSEMVNHWASTDFSREWENISDQDAGDVNLAEVWRDGEHHLRTEAMHEKLAFGEGVPLSGDYPVFSRDFTETIEIVHMGEKFIHARTPFGDAYCDLKLTNIVKSHGGVGSIIQAKIVKADPTLIFPWRVIYLTPPPPETSGIWHTEVKIIRMGKKFILGNVNGEKVWIDPKMTKLIRSFDTDVFKMKLVRSDHGFPWKATFVHPPA